MRPLDIYDVAILALLFVVIAVGYPEFFSS
jgi:hypothetical protein